MLSDIDDDWKNGLTMEQLQKVEQLESCLATANLQLQEASEKSPSKCQSCLSNVVVEIHEASSDDLDMSTSHHHTVSCTSPTSPSSLLTSQPPPTADTSPSLRSLNPGYVSSLADFWSNKWKMENNDCSKASQDANGQEWVNVNETAEDCEEVNHLKETIMIQCQLFRATEDENLKLKEDNKNLELQNKKIVEDLDQLRENLKIRESTVTKLRENLKDCNKKVSKLIDQDVEKECRIAEFEEKFGNNAPKIEVLVKENLKIEQELKESNAKFENEKAKNTKLKKGLDKYEEIVNDLKNQVVPVQNLKVKMASLDQDVNLLKRRLQNSVRSTSMRPKTATKADTLTMTKTLPYCTSTKKRRWSPTENDAASPAKILRIAETTLTNKPSETAFVKKEVKAPEFDCGRSYKPSSVVSPKSKSRFGRQVEDCKQQ